MDSAFHGCRHVLEGSSNGLIDRWQGLRVVDIYAEQTGMRGPLPNELFTTAIKGTRLKVV
jgi:hypothetical protein